MAGRPLRGVTADQQIAWAALLRGVWPRSSLQGVVLGDGVKGDEAESFSFDPAGVTIRYVVRGQPQSVYVPFEQSGLLPVQARRRD